MEPTYPSSWAGLRYPWQRRELLLYLEELAVPDPRARWAAERRSGLIAGIDQVLHYLFDDHDFDESDLGYSLLYQTEVVLVQAVKQELDQILAELPDGGDDDYATNLRWPAVVAAASAAYAAMVDR